MNPLIILYSIPFKVLADIISLQTEMNYIVLLVKMIPYKVQYIREMSFMKL